jgi:mono/diheme cytochrome c family protein
MTSYQSGSAPEPTQCGWLIIAMVTLVLWGCSPAKGQPSTSKKHASIERHVSAEEQQAYERARPVFERYCASCHTSKGGSVAALVHFSMDGYPFGGHHADDIAGTIREVLGVNGEKATMPQGRPGVVKGEELQLVIDWANTVERAQASAPPHGHEGGH